MLSVVIPCRNAADQVVWQLDALAAQRDDAAFEVVVVDNRSTDGIRRAVERFADRLDIRLIDAAERSGRAYACNIGANAALGEAVVFIDADDEVAPGYVAAMASALSRSDFVAARLDCSSLNRGWVAATRAPFQVDGPLDVLSFLPFAIGCSLGVTRRAFETVGGFTEDVPFAEDVELCWRLQLHGFPLMFVPDAVLRYRYRHSIAGLYTQTAGYGLGQVALYRKFRSVGMPGRSLSLALRDWYWLLRATPSLLRTRSGAAVWAHQLGYRMGRLKGSLRYHTVYL